MNSGLSVEQSLKNIYGKTIYIMNMKRVSILP
jgi:hypothetical protein